MRRYELHQTGVTKKPAMYILANNENEAWKKVSQAGIKNKSKLLKLVEIRNDIEKRIVKNIVGDDVEIPKERNYKLMR